jgi:hypothetical protein
MRQMDYIHLIIHGHSTRLPPKPLGPRRRSGQVMALHCLDRWMSIQYSVGH